jgi:hypothetical protein
LILRMSSEPLAMLNELPQTGSGFNTSESVATSPRSRGHPNGTAGAAAHRGREIEMEHYELDL